MNLPTIYDNLTQRDKAIVVGIFLPKYDREALQLLGFDTFRQAYNTLGYATGTTPGSVKLYRDEFDSHFPNSRHGWNRGLREYCIEVLHKVERLSLADYTDLIGMIVSGNPDIFIPDKHLPHTTFSAQRLITGEAAEQYFKDNYRDEPLFEGYECRDTTKTGCGFDFKLTKGFSYYCVEVKGINSESGKVVMTNKEYDTATCIGDRYDLYVVKGFCSQPSHTLYLNPTHNDSLEWSMAQRTTTITTYTSTI